MAGGNGHFSGWISCILTFRDRGILSYIVFPGDFVGRGVSLDVTLEVDVIALLQVPGVHRGAQVELHVGRDCDKGNT